MMGHVITLCRAGRSFSVGAWGFGQHMQCCSFLFPLIFDATPQYIRGTALYLLYCPRYLYLVSSWFCRRHLGALWS